MPPKFKNSSQQSSSSSSGPRVIYWFRTDLRLHDSPALKAALDLKPSVFYPIWTWDPHYVYRARVGPNRWRFLTECQADLSRGLTKLNSKQRLHLIREAPQTVFPKLFKLWNITHLVFEKDTDAYARDRDDEVCKLAKEAGVEVIIKVGRTLFDPDEIVKNNHGKPTMTMSQLVKAAQPIDKGKPPRPIDAPTSIPDPGDTDLSSIDHQIPSPKPDFNAGQRSLGEDKEVQYQSIMGPKKDFAVPTLEEMGIDPSTAISPHKGGETVALALLKKYIDDEEYTATFEKPKSAPTDFEPQSTTLLSPHHHFGSLSIRKFYWDVQDVFDKRRKANKPVAGQPENLIGQILFRDMYFAAQAALGYSFAQTQGNPVAKFVDWHLQSNYSKSPVGEHLLDGTYNVDSKEAEEWFRRWKAGQTGFPWIDALMRQLKQEGWIHHLGRHAVACFLTRGGCYVSWERGAEVFEEWLIDHETACNVGNWMWLSCTAFFSQFYRCYSPIAFPKKWDPEGTFVKRYCPELSSFPSKYIYEPHKAPIADQKSWGCQVVDWSEYQKSSGQKYPKPMFDFNQRRQICLDGMKKAYDKGLMGDDSKVISGEWKKEFGYDDSNAEIRDETNVRNLQVLRGASKDENGNKRDDNVKGEEKDIAKRGKKRQRQSNDENGDSINHDGEDKKEEAIQGQGQQDDQDMREYDDGTFTEKRDDATADVSQKVEGPARKAVKTEEKSDIGKTKTELKTSGKNGQRKQTSLDGMVTRQKGKK